MSSKIQFNWTAGAAAHNRRVNLRQSTSWCAAKQTGSPPGCRHTSCASRPGLYRPPKKPRSSGPAEPSAAHAVASLPVRLCRHARMRLMRCMQGQIEESRHSSRCESLRGSVARQTTAGGLSKRYQCHSCRTLLRTRSKPGDIAHATAAASSTRSALHPTRKSSTICAWGNVRWRK